MINRIRELLEKGKSTRETFKILSEETGKSVAAIRAYYYRHKSDHITDHIMSDHISDHITDHITDHISDHTAPNGATVSTEDDVHTDICIDEKFPPPKKKFSSTGFIINPTTDKDIQYNLRMRQAMVNKRSVGK